MPVLDGEFLKWKKFFFFLIFDFWFLIPSILFQKKLKPEVIINRIKEPHKTRLVFYLWVKKKKVLYLVHPKLEMAKWLCMIVLYVLNAQKWEHLRHIKNHV
jgi:hypothetical protein